MIYGPSFASETSVNIRNSTFHYTDVRVFLYRVEKKNIYLEAERLVMVIAIKDVRHSLLLERLKLFGAHELYN